MNDPQISEALRAAAQAIQPPLPEHAFRAQLDQLTKPIGALGRLEDLAVQLQQLRLSELHKAVYVFAADHGLSSEGVSAYPAEVTRQMVLNFLAGGAAINVLARLHGASLHIVDCGVQAGSPPFPEDPRLISAPIRAGSRNMLYEPALSDEEFAAACTLGLRCANDAAARGYTLVAAGEMGIGNTAAASAITAALTGVSVAEVTGRGTGLNTEARTHKVAILGQVLALHGPHMTSPAAILRHVGGLEIAAMAAFIIGCASHGIAVVVDGFISTAAAACAQGMCPALHPWLFAGHQSEEPGHAVLLRRCNLQPILSLGMRLGEGTGAVLAMPILESALRLAREMATFASAGVASAGETA